MTTSPRPAEDPPDGPEDPRRDRFSSSSSPSSIGPYRILGKLGEGGMGIVFEAEQQQPRRRVAVKVVRSGEFVDETRIRLFRREVDALARLKHAGIAAIYEAGRTPDGQHFFAMELVRGTSLADYLASRPAPASRADVAFRLRLFIGICEAVHYAHQRGVIHRDLKPSNVVLADEPTSGSTHHPALPTVKVLDFGLARITASDGPAVTLQTEIGAVRGTLAYMSPEQTRGDPDAIDVRTDVYSLGVILYEMLSGRRPYDLSKLSIAEALSTICETSPAPLRAPPESGVRIDVDLDTIARKALEKEPDRRYASAASLAEDVERYLASQPVLARPPSAIYQLRKFAARNRFLVASALTSVAVIAAAAVVATLFGLREARQRREVERTRTELAEVVEFQDGLLQDLDPSAMGRRLLGNLKRRVGEGERATAFDLAMRAVNATDVAVDVLDQDVLKRAVETVDRRFADQPQIAARLYRTLARSYAALGRPEAAEPLAQRSFELRASLLGPADPQTLESEFTLGDVLHRSSRFDESVRLLREVLETRRRLLGPEDRATIEVALGLGTVLTDWGRYDQAVEILDPTATTCARVFGADDVDTIDATWKLSRAYLYEERIDLGEPLLRRAIEANRRVRGPEDDTTLDMTSALGLVLLETDKAAAERLYLDYCATLRRLKGDDHPSTLRATGHLALVYAKLGRDQEALDLLKNVHEAYRRVLGPEHEQTLDVLHNIAAEEETLGHVDEAERIFRELIEVRARILGPGSPRRLRTMRSLAALLLRQHRTEEAESLAKEALEAARGTTLGERGTETAELLRILRTIYFSQGRFAEVVPVLERLIEFDRGVSGAEGNETLADTADLGGAVMGLGQLDRADELYTRVLEARKRKQGESADAALLTQVNLACVRVRQGRRDDAIELVRDAVDRGCRHAAILTDHDLDPLRSDPRFAALASEVARRRAQPQR